MREFCSDCTSILAHYAKSDASKLINPQFVASGITTPETYSPDDYETESAATIKYSTPEQ